MDGTDDKKEFADTTVSIEALVKIPVQYNAVDHC